MRKPPILIANEIYWRSRIGGRHPLAIPRVSTVIDLVRALGWFDAARYREAPQAAPEELARFHDRAYIAAVAAAEARQRVSEDERRRYGLGGIGAPIYGEMYRRPAIAAGAALLAADIAAGGGVVFTPASGTHHGRAARASGYCIFNDPVLAILRLLDRGVGRIVYVDIDAHHGDGVELAFADDRRVLTISVHETGRWPGTGAVEDRAGGWARNLPVPRGFNDSEMAYVIDCALLPLARVFMPEALVLQCGVDALAEDPQSRLGLSNAAYWEAVRALMTVAPRVIVTGGGGYNPWAAARCWAGVWGVLDGRTVPAHLPPAAQAVLGALGWRRLQGRAPPRSWTKTLADAPRSGPVRDAVKAVVRQVMMPPAV